MSAEEHRLVGREEAIPPDQLVKKESNACCGEGDFCCIPKDELDYWRETGGSYNDWDRK